MLSRSGKATENMHLTLAKVKKMYTKQAIEVIVEVKSAKEKSCLLVGSFYIVLISVVGWRNRRVHKRKKVKIGRKKR
jgi:hypothetical protein